MSDVFLGVSPLLFLLFASAVALFAAGCTQSSTIADGGVVRSSCCMGGTIGVCYCPVGVACNYGAFVSCDDGLHCGPSGTDPATCAPVVYDAGPDLGACTPEPCCVGGMVSTCCCPPPSICNYGAFIRCDDGLHCGGPGTDPLTCLVPDAGDADASVSGDAAASD